MEKNSMKVITRILSVLMLSVSMTACNSVRSLYDSTQIQENEQQGDRKDDVKQAEIYTEDVATSGPEEMSILSKQICGLGEEVSEIDIDKGKVIPNAFVYRVKKATIFKDITEAGISEGMLPSYIEGDFFDEDGKIKPGVKFLVVEMTVKNICGSTERTITSFDLLYADSMKETLDKTREIDFFELPLPAYFSHPSGSQRGEDWPEYYHYNLPVGQSKDLKVGWYIDFGQYNPSNIYLVFNRYEDELRRFVKLLE